MSSPRGFVLVAVAAVLLSACGGSSHTRSAAHKVHRIQLTDANYCGTMMKINETWMTDQSTYPRIDQDKWMANMERVSRRASSTLARYRPPKKSQASYKAWGDQFSSFEQAGHDGSASEMNDATPKIKAAAQAMANEGYSNDTCGRDTWKLPSS